MAGLALNGYAGLPSSPWEGPLPLEERPAATVAGQIRGQQYPLPEELSAILACQCSGPGHNVAHLCSVTHVPAERDKGNVCLHPSPADNRILSVTNHVGLPYRCTVSSVLKLK